MIKIKKYYRSNKFKIAKNRNNGEILLMKSEHPIYSYEVYSKQTGLFYGYTGNKENREKEY